MSILLVCMMFSTYTIALHCSVSPDTQTHRECQTSHTIVLIFPVVFQSIRELEREENVRYEENGTVTVLQVQSRTPLLTLQSTGLWVTPTHDTCLRPGYGPQSKAFQPSPANQQNLIAFASSKSIEYKLKDHI